MRDGEMREGWITEVGFMDDYDESDYYKGRVKTFVLYSEDQFYLIYRPAAKHSPKYGVLHPCGKNTKKPSEMIRIDSAGVDCDKLICPVCKQRPSDEFFLAWSLRDDTDQSGGGNAVPDDREFAIALAAELKKSRPKEMNFIGKALKALSK